MSFQRHFVLLSALDVLREESLEPSLDRADVFLLREELNEVNEVLRALVDVWLDKTMTVQPIELGKLALQQIVFLLALL